MKEEKIEKVEVIKDKIRVTLTFDKQKILNREVIDYSDRDRIVSESVKFIVEETLKGDVKERIIKQVLKDVNWPEIVRSEIAQKVIAEAGKTQDRY